MLQVFCLLSNIRGLTFFWKGKIMALMRVHKGQKSIGIFFPRLVVHLTFFLTWFQIFKSKLLSSRNQGLCSITVWRQASNCWCETKSPWTLNKWWSKVEKWWGFPAICPITPHLPTSVGPQSLRLVAKGILQVPVWVPLDMVFLTDQNLGTGVDEKKLKKRRAQGTQVSSGTRVLYSWQWVLIHCNTRTL